MILRFSLQTEPLEPKSFVILLSPGISACCGDSLMYYWHLQNGKRINLRMETLVFVFCLFWGFLFSYFFIQPCHAKNNFFSDVFFFNPFFFVYFFTQQYEVIGSKEDCNKEDCRRRGRGKSGRKSTKRRGSGYKTGGRSDK